MSEFDMLEIQAAPNFVILEAHHQSTGQLEEIHPSNTTCGCHVGPSWTDLELIVGLLRLSTTFVGR
jgi:hypothetical protein